ncbi:MAG TPA: hypothetical protein PLJ21_11110, partial [Pseudobdellovibrionaceae bacterium]|nr:hypothetical protein [Pseudobdellovibrionaceae bacterium]
TAISHGNANSRGLGNIGRKLADEINMVIGALIFRDQEYAILKEFDYEIYCEDPTVQVIDIRSASLAIALLLNNIKRILLGKSPLVAAAATGRVLPDGSVDQVDFLASKEEALKKNEPVRCFLTYEDISDLGQLNDIVNALAEK